MSEENITEKQEVVKAEKKLPRFKFRLNRKFIPLIIILLTIPLTVGLVLVAQEYRGRAGGYPGISRVDIQPGIIRTTLAKPITTTELSTLAFNANGSPIYGGVVYNWSLSSTIDTVGTLTITQGNITQFIPQRAGCGQLTVSAFDGTTKMDKSIAIIVSDGITFPSCANVLTTPLDYQTRDINLSAKDFYIDINGKKFRFPNSDHAVSAPVYYGSDGNYITELVGNWFENGVPMQLKIGFIYKPGAFWEVREVQTYDGTKEAKWIYYATTDEFGQKIQNGLDDSYISPSLDLLSNPKTNPNTKAVIHFESINLKPFLSLIPKSPTPTQPPTPTPTPINSKSQTSLSCITSINLSDYNTHTLGVLLLDQNRNPLVGKNIVWSLTGISKYPMINPLSGYTGSTGYAYTGLSIPSGFSGSGNNTVKSEFPGDTEYYPATCQTNVNYAITPTPTRTPSPLPIQKTSMITTQDTFVRADKATTNFGYGTRLRALGSPNVISYLKFDLTPVIGKKIVSAKLVLKVSTDTGSGSTDVFTLKSVSPTGWNEGQVTYKTRPVLGNSLVSFSGKGDGQNIEIDVKNFLGNSRTISYAIVSSGKNELILNSRESGTASYRPQLVIEYQ
jgi:hypothetical protein